MKESVLIINRSEIACRIIRTAKKLGIKAIGLYSFPDRNALHARLADMAVPLGDSDSYLNIPEIISIIQKLKPTFVHPGYGFLSESSEFARLIETTKSVFVGPSPDVIDLMGDKITCKKLAQKLKVPLIPGFTLSGSENVNGALIDKIRKIGFPIMIKAANGGGGKGMRIIRNQNEIMPAIESAARESKAFFNSGKLFAERFIPEARHVEVQVLADRFGNVHIAGDRDCTYQRSNQKVIEEAPAPGLPEELREKIHSHSKNLFLASGYQGAGTAEFLYTADKEIFFLEINSRIQVEHPVTEETSGYDLVELQFEVARGRKLASLKNYQSKKTAVHAIELRLCAESPYENFIPTTGKLEQLALQADRVDAGFEAGDYITHFYDSLVAKLIVTGSSREQAITKALKCCTSSIITGVETNLDFLSSLLAKEDFKNCTHHTRIIESYLQDQTGKQEKALYLAALKYSYEIITSRFYTRLLDDESAGEKIKDKHYRILGDLYRVSALDIFPTTFAVKVTAIKTGLEREIHFHCPVPLKNQMNFLLDNRERAVSFLNRDWIKTDEGIFHVEEAAIEKNNLGGNQSSLSGTIPVSSTLPGKIITIKIKAGDLVEVNQDLVVIESMKMEHVIKSAVGGKIGRIYVEEGAFIDKGKPITEIIAF